MHAGLIAGMRYPLHRMLRIALCTVLVAAAFTWPAPASAVTKSTAAKQRTAAAIAKDLAAVRAKLQTAGRAYDNALHALENTGSKIKSTDRRIKHLHLSPAGHKEFTRIWACAVDLRREILSGLSQAEINTTLEVLQKIRSKVESLT